MNHNEFNLISNEEMERAIKMMQKYASIPQTGKMDRLTMKMMRAPRCGMPDVVSELRLPVRRNNTNARYNARSNIRSNARYRIRSKRFVVYGPKWNKSPIFWK